MTVGGGGRGLSGAGPMFKKHLGCPDNEASFRVASSGKNMMQCQVGTLSVCMHHNVSFNTFSSVATVTILASEKKKKNRGFMEPIHIPSASCLRYYCNAGLL